MNKAIDCKTIAVVLNAANSTLEIETRVGLKLPEVGEAQGATSAVAEVALQTKVFKIRCAFKILLVKSAILCIELNFVQFRS